MIPQVTAPAVGGWTSGTIADYFGLPIGVNSLSQSALPLRAYNLIYNEWFRDENLINSGTTPTGDGPDSSSLYGLWRRGKRHDYFTSCLPWPQKGPSVANTPYRDWETDRKSTRLNSSHRSLSRMPSSA